MCRVDKSVYSVYISIIAGSHGGRRQTEGKKMSTTEKRLHELNQARAEVGEWLRRGLRLDQAFHALEYIWTHEWMLIEAQMAEM